MLVLCRELGGRETSASFLQMCLSAERGCPRRAEGLLSQHSPATPSVSPAKLSPDTDRAGEPGPSVLLALAVLMPSPPSQDRKAPSAVTHGHTDRAMVSYLRTAAQVTSNSTTRNSSTLAKQGTGTVSPACLKSILSTEHCFPHTRRQL